jgi:hypothetical protein
VREHLADTGGGVGRHDLDEAPVGGDGEVLAGGQGRHGPYEIPVLRLHVGERSQGRHADLEEMPHDELAAPRHEQRGYLAEADEKREGLPGPRPFG